VQVSFTRRLDDAERRRMGAKILEGTRDSSPEDGAASSSSLQRRRHRRGKRTGSRSLVPSRARRLVPLIFEVPERMGFPAAFSAAAAVWAGALVFA
jgi:hypothetical protein